MTENATKTDGETATLRRDLVGARAALRRVEYLLAESTAPEAVEALAEVRESLYGAKRTPAPEDQA